LKRDYKHELIIDQQEKINYDNCIDHYLLYTFRICIEMHTSRYKNYVKFYNFFKNISTQIEFTKLELLDNL